KKDRKGNFLDHRGEVIKNVTTEHLMAAVKMPEKIKEQHRTTGKKPHPPNRDGTPVHLMDIHLEKGMHCVDCHFVQDAHGNGKLYGEVRAAIEIQCIDCHGTISKHATLRTSGPASAEPGGRDLATLRTPFGA